MTWWCPHCGGGGWIRRGRFHIDKCEPCNGTGLTSYPSVTDETEP